MTHTYRASYRFSNNPISNMNSKTILLIFTHLIYLTNGAVLLWSNRKFEVSPLSSFTDESFEELIEELGYPEVALYKSSVFVPEMKRLLKGYYTAYSPNGDINTENATEISGQDDLEQLETKQRIDLSSDFNVLSVLVVPTNGRFKRQSSNNSTESTTSTSYKAPSGAVFYKGVSKKDEKTYGLLYSSQPLVFKTANNTISIGGTPSDQITLDTTNRDAYTRLSIKVKLEDANIIILRFIFSWSHNYWSLSSVRISDTDKYYNFNLSTAQDITAPARFSYHCSGETVFSFSDGNSTVTLTIADLQVQIDSPSGKFSDAYDCVNFTTGPILSGLFVTAIIGIGLIVGLAAILEIKTMDKFDNHKTKQLVITLSE